MYLAGIIFQVTQVWSVFGIFWHSLQHICINTVVELPRFCTEELQVCLAVPSAPVEKLATECDS